MNGFSSASDAVTVAAGTNLLSGGNEEVYKSVHIVWHKGFSMKTANDDVAMIRVDRDIKFNDKVKPVNLAKINLSKAGTPVVLTGWGYTDAVCLIILSKKFVRPNVKHCVIVCYSE